MTDDTRPEGFDLDDPTTWCGTRLLAYDRDAQTCGGFGPAPETYEQAVEDGLVGPGTVWEDRAAFEAWRAKADEALDRDDD